MEPHTNKCHVYLQLTKAEIQQSTGAAYTIIRSGDTTKYRSRLYNNTKRRYNKVPEPPIYQYKAEIQQSTGAAEYRQHKAEIQQSTGAADISLQGGDTTKYRSRRYINTSLSCRYSAIIPRLRFTENISSRCTVLTIARYQQSHYNTITPRPRYTGSTSSRHSYNDSVLLQGVIPRPRYTKSTRSTADTVTRITVLLQFTHDTGPRYTRSTSSRTQLRELPYCYNYTRYGTEIHQEYQQSHTVTRITVLLQLHTILHQEYQQSNTVTRTTVLLQLHTIRDRDTPGVPAVEHTRTTVLLQLHTIHRYTRSTSSRTLPYCYNYTRYRTEIHQEYQQSHTVTRITVLLQLHTIRDRDTPGVPAVAHSYENYRTVTITHDTEIHQEYQQLHSYTRTTITHDTGPRYTRSTSSRTHNYTRYRTEIHQEYQQSHTVTVTITHDTGPRYTRSTSSRTQLRELPYCYNYTRYEDDTATITRYTRSTSSRTQLRELPYCYNYTRYRTEIHQEYQQSHTVTVTITRDTGPRYTRSTSSRTQLPLQLHVTHDTGHSYY